MNVNIQQTTSKKIQHLLIPHRLITTPFVKEWRCLTSPFVLKQGCKPFLGHTKALLRSMSCRSSTGGGRLVVDDGSKLTWCSLDPTQVVYRWVVLQGRKQNLRYEKEINYNMFESKSSLENWRNPICEPCNSQKADNCDSAYAGLIYRQFYNKGLIFGIVLKIKGNNKVPCIQA